MARKGGFGNVCPRCNGAGYVADDRVIGARRRHERESAGLNLREMARRMEVSAAYLSDLELGRRRWNKKQLDRFAKVLR